MDNIQETLDKIADLTIDIAERTSWLKCLAATQDLDEHDGYVISAMKDALPETRQLIDLSSQLIELVSSLAKV